jgi:post-segregation antitoxin (ccd killing protein)
MVAESKADSEDVGTAESRVQLNVQLPKALVRQAKHRAVDEGVSVSGLVERALADYLRSPLIERRAS